MLNNMIEADLKRMSEEIQRLKQHNKETKRLIKDCFCNNCYDQELLTVWREEHTLLIKHVNKRKI